MSTGAGRSASRSRSSANRDRDVSSHRVNDNANSSSIIGDESIGSDLHDSKIVLFKAPIEPVNEIQRLCAFYGSLNDAGKRAVETHLVNAQRYLDNCNKYNLSPDPGVIIGLNTGWNILQPTKRFVEGGLLPLIDVLGDVEHVKKLKMRGTSMTEPKFRDSGNGNTNARALQYILRTNKSIEYLDLSDTGLDDDGILEICEGLNHNKSVTDVNLSYNHFGEVGAKLLRDTLLKNETIKKLDVTRNGLDFNSINTLVVCCKDRDTKIETQGNFVFEEVLNSVTHGIGFFLSIVAGQILVSAAYDKKDLGQFHYWGCVVFSFSLIFLFLSSTLFHAFFMSPLVSRVLQICDHIGIYMVIAGSYTPVLMIALPECTNAKVLLIMEWFGFLFGMVFSAFADLSGNAITQAVELTVFLSMGAGFFMIWEDFIKLPCGLVTLCGLSCTMYCIGIVFFIMGDKKHPIYHSVWHLFVVLAAGLHWFGVYLFIINKDEGQKFMDKYNLQKNLYLDWGCKTN